MLWHVGRIRGQLDRRFFLVLFQGIVTSPAGRLIGWLVILFGVAMLGTITGALVAMVIDFLLKEGQGLGAVGFKGHIVICGWNTTARDLIEHAAPGVRTVAEVNNPKHEPHFRRADVDELLVTSKIASHLLARSALYPGLTGIVTDIVSGGEGSELYRITLPDAYIGLSIDAVAGRLRTEHQATLLSVNRGGHAFVNPGADFVLKPDDDAVVVAESLGTLAPLEMSQATVAPRTSSVCPRPDVRAGQPGSRRRHVSTSAVRDGSQPSNKAWMRSTRVARGRR